MSCNILIALPTHNLHSTTQDVNSSTERYPAQLSVEPCSVQSSMCQYNFVICSEQKFQSGLFSFRVILFSSHFCLTDGFVMSSSYKAPLKTSIEGFIPPSQCSTVFLSCHARKPHWFILDKSISLSSCVRRHCLHNVVCLFFFARNCIFLFPHPMYKDRICAFIFSSLLFLPQGLEDLRYHQLMK